MLQVHRVQYPGIGAASPDKVGLTAQKACAWCSRGSDGMQGVPGALSEGGGKILARSERLAVDREITRPSAHKASAC